MARKPETTEHIEGLSSLSKEDQDLGNLEDQLRATRRELFKAVESARDHLDAAIEALVRFDKASGGVQVAYMQKGEDYRKKMVDFANQNQKHFTQTRGKPKKKVTFADVTVVNGDISFDNADYDQGHYEVKQKKFNSPLSKLNTPMPPPLIEKRPIHGICFNCKETGHRYRDCPHALRIFCRVCGCPDVTRLTCPNKCVSKFSQVFPESR